MSLRKTLSNVPLDSFIRDTLDEDDRRTEEEDTRQTFANTLNVPDDDGAHKKQRSGSVPPKVKSGADKEEISKSKNFWQQRCENYEVDRLINPFSEFWGGDRRQYRNVLENAKAVWKGADKRTRLTKTDNKYGQVVEGTLTEYRGKKAKNFIANNIIECCDTIRTLADRQEPDGTYKVEFGKLFKAYERINDKLVGLLVRARRHGLVEFPGEMLYQGQDDRVIITCFKVPTLEELELKYISFSKPEEETNPDHSAQ